MGRFFAFVGSLLVFFGAACIVADVLRFAVAGSDQLLSVTSMLKALFGIDVVAMATASPAWAAWIWTPMIWILGLPTWLVCLLIGVPLAMGGRERERSFG